MKNYRKLVMYSIIVSMITFVLSMTVGEEGSKSPIHVDVAMAQTNDTTNLASKEMAMVSKSYVGNMFTALDGTQKNILVASSIETDNVTTNEPIIEKKEFYQVDSWYLNVRSEANDQAHIADVLVNGWIVESNQKLDNGWISLKDGGYINGKYAKFITSADAEKILTKQLSEPKPKPVFNEPTPIVDTPAPIKHVTVTPDTKVSKTSNTLGGNINTTKNEKQIVNTAYSSADKDLLARLVRAESTGEPFAGKVAVALVVLNRIDSDEFPDSIRSVIYEPGQFSPVSNGAINKPADSESIRAVNVALSTDRTGNKSLYFYNPDIASSRWLDGRSTVAVIGNHVFKR